MWIESEQLRLISESSESQCNKRDRGRRLREECPTSCISFYGYWPSGWTSRGTRQLQRLNDLWHSTVAMARRRSGSLSGLGNGIVSACHILVAYSNTLELDLGNACRIQDNNAAVGLVFEWHSSVACEWEKVDGSARQDTATFSYQLTHSPWHTMTTMPVKRHPRRSPSQS